MIEVELKIVPRSIESFRHKFDIKLNTKELVEAYILYLQTNSDDFHYNGKTQLEWLQEEVAQYKANNPKG